MKKHQAFFNDFFNKLKILRIYYFTCLAVLFQEFERGRGGGEHRNRSEKILHFDLEILLALLFMNFDFIQL